MNKDLEIYKTLVSSTYHIEESDIELVDSEPIFSTYPTDYGIRIFLSDDILNEVGKHSFSEGFKLLVLFAVSNDCQYLELDSDGEQYEIFPVYDW